MWRNPFPPSSIALADAVDAQVAGVGVRHSAIAMPEGRVLVYCGRRARALHQVLDESVSCRAPVSASSATSATEYFRAKACAGGR